MFVIINLVGIRWFARINNALTRWKVVIPVVTVVVLLSATSTARISANWRRLLRQGRGGQEHPDHATGGIMFSLLGFEQAVQLGGESKNPGVTCHGR